MPNLQSLRIAKPRGPDPRQPNDPLDFSAHTLRYLSLYNIPLYPSILSLRTLIEFPILHSRIDLHLDTILGFLEESHSLESASLDIAFTKPSLRRSRRQTPAGNRLRHLAISYKHAVDGQAQISNIALRRGTTLEIHSGDIGGLTDILFGVSITHLSNLSSAISMEYISHNGTIRLLGPHGSFLHIRQLV